MVRKNSRQNPSEISLKISPSERQYGILLIPSEHRHLLPGYKVQFTLNTNQGTRSAQVTSAEDGTEIGDREAGNYICGRLGQWYRDNRVRVGTDLTLRRLAPKVFHLEKKL